MTTSKFLSYVLRHHPAKIGIALDPAGWVSVEDLLAALAAHGEPTTRAELFDLVATSDKKRFALSEDQARIRASQGHSVPVDLGYTPLAPPAVLYHGTVDKFLGSIRAVGLTKGQRHHVHLSADTATATVVGQRRGRPVLLTIDAAAAFFRSANGVWLTDHVPPAFIRFPESS
jgi:putative RNA 2'-phosphotransferase